MGKYIISLAIVFCVIGCGHGGTEMTKDETDRLLNPSREIPPEAAEAMAKGMSEGVARQKERAEAAGVDSQGIPLDKSKWNTAPPPD